MTEEQPPSPPLNSMNEVEACRKAAKQLLFAAGSIALLAIVAGLSGHSTLAIWCLPIAVIVGVAANAKNQDVRRMTNPAGGASLAREVGEGVLLSVLALFFVALLFALWFWHRLGQWHG